MERSEPQGRRAPRHLADVTMFWGAASGGVRRYVRAKRRWLSQARRWRHTVVVPGESRREDDVLGVPSLPLPMAPGYRMAISRRAAAARITALAPDLIEAGDPYNLAWAALDAARALQVPAVAFVHSDLMALAARVGGRPAELAAARYARHLYSRFDLVLAPGRALTERLHSLQLGAPVLQQPLGVDTARFNPACCDRFMRRRLGLSESTRVLLYAGRFAPEKNLPLLTAALRRLGPGYAMVAVGDGPRPPRAERNEHLIVLPFERDEGRLAALIAASDVFVHAGDIETFGLAALEAMACGTPVVARAQGGLAELIDDSVGAAVPAGRAEAFAQAVQAVCARGRGALSAACRERALGYDWQRVLPQLDARYSELVAGARRRTDPLDERGHEPDVLAPQR